MDSIIMDFRHMCGEHRFFAEAVLVHYFNSREGIDIDCPHEENPEYPFPEEPYEAYELFSKKLDGFRESLTMDRQRTLYRDLLGTCFHEGGEFRHPKKNDLDWMVGKKYHNSIVFADMASVTESGSEVERLEQKLSELVHQLTTDSIHFRTGMQVHWRYQGRIQSAVIEQLNPKHTATLRLKDRGERNGTLVHNINVCELCPDVSWIDGEIRKTEKALKVAVAVQGKNTKAPTHPPTRTTTTTPLSPPTSPKTSTHVHHVEDVSFMRHLLEVYGGECCEQLLDLFYSHQEKTIDFDNDEEAERDWKRLQDVLSSRYDSKEAGLHLLQASQ
jgi:hypothetical protein